MDDDDDNFLPATRAVEATPLDPFSKTTTTTTTTTTTSALIAQSSNR
jgi:hypothetical protein